MCVGMANGGKQVANDGKMMLLQRAIESAKNRVYYIDVNSMGDISYHHHKKAENQKELMNTTVEALKKQIPKRAIMKGFSPCEEICSVSYLCPVCKKHINIDKYCYHCGQALNWSDTE